MDKLELNARYRLWFHTLRPDCPWYERASDIPQDTDCARIGREGLSYRGLGQRPALRLLEASKVNQDMLEEIAQLGELEYLELGWPVMAKELSPLAALSKLEVLKIESPRHIGDFSVIPQLPALRHLFITNAKKLTTLDWLVPMKNRLLALGIEGSTWTQQVIPTLAPLRGFALEALFLTGTRLQDQDLSAIAEMPDLRFLGTALNAPKAEFMALSAARPRLVCDWFDEAAWIGMRDPAPPAALSP